MSLELEDERHYQKNEPESWQNFIIKYVCRQNKSRYPHKLLFNVSDKHTRMFRPFTAECQYHLEFTCKNQPCGVATIYHPIQLKNRKKN